MFQFFLKPLCQNRDITIEKLDKSFKKHFAPAKANLSLGTLTDLARSKLSMVAENALLRQQLIVLQRQVNKPKFRPLDRVILVILAGLVTNWRQALLIVKPETLSNGIEPGLSSFGNSNPDQRVENPKYLHKQFY